MSGKLITAIKVAPVLLTFGLYGMILGRFFNNAIWFLWLQVAFFLMLCLCGLAMVVSLIAVRHHTRFLIVGLVLGFFGLLGSFPVTRFMLDRRDERFIRNLSRYDEAITWIRQHEGATPRDDQFPGLAPDIMVQKNPAGALL